MFFIPPENRFSENRRFFDIFRGYKMGTRVGNELIVGTYIGNRICEKDIIF